MSLSIRYSPINRKTEVSWIVGSENRSPTATSAVVAVGVVGVIRFSNP